MNTKEQAREIREEILEETEHPKEDVRIGTITRYLDEGMTSDDIIALYLVSDAYRNSFIGNGGTGKEHSIPIGNLKEFVDQFFPDGYTAESLNDDVVALVGLTKSYVTADENARRLCCRSGDHITCLVKSATRIGKDHAIFNFNDLVDFLTGHQATWWMCQELEIAS